MTLEEIIQHMESQYPETMEAMKSLNDEHYEVFAKKQMAYGPGNISMGGNEGLALLALSIRMNDKVQRLLNILYHNDGVNPMATEEPLKDTFMDLSVYGKIALILMEGKWGK